MSGPRALLDTTVFCGALVKSDGYNMRLLELGSTPLYRPIIIQSVIAEFIHKAVTDGIGKGSRKRHYTSEEIQVFLMKFGDILDPREAEDIGATYNYVSTFPANTPLWVVLSKLADAWPVNSDISKKLNRPIRETDLGDIHIALGVLKCCPDVLVTSNIKDLAYLNSFCQVMKPSEFLQYIDAL
ncbi:MAG TPA: hypothetical protein GXZ26_10770 [Firmicutes bacterium]|jgi:hypothetical protein|nr:hypothetical protein [Bacillota bacterium]